MESPLRKLSKEACVLEGRSYYWRGGIDPFLARCGAYMSEQRTLASVVYDTKRKVTRRERFLQEMERASPWATLRALVEPHYTKPGRGRRPMPLEMMLRIYFQQQWFDLSDPQAEDMLYDSESMRPTNQLTNQPTNQPTN